MSSYIKEKVLRVPFSKYHSSIAKNFPCIDFDNEDWFWELEKQRPLLIGYREQYKFSASPTAKPFIDFVLEVDEDADCEDYGKVRNLRDTEKQKYAEIFKKIIPDIDMNDVRLVEFCWYNCCEALDYYNITEDSFYDEI